MEPFLFLIVILVIVAAIAVPVGLSFRRLANQAWTEAARVLGLRYVPPAMFSARRIEGNLNGYGATVDTFTRSSGKSSATYTRFNVRYPEALGLGLKLTREGLLSGFAKRLGAQDIEVGDGVFDPDVLVKGTDPRGVVDFLTRARRVRIHRFLMNYKDATITDTGIHWHTRGVFRDASRIVSTVKALTTLAWHLGGNRREDLRLERALTARNAGRPEEALHVLGEAAAPTEVKPPPVPVIEAQAEEEPERRDAAREVPPVPLDVAPVEEQVLEGELLHLAGRDSEAQAVFERALAAAPEDSEIREWVERAPERLPRTEPPEPGPPEPGPPSPPPEEPPAEEPPAEVPQAEITPPSPPPAPAETPPALDVETVCRELFDPKRSSYQANQRFEKHYRGREIGWSGVLRDVESYSYDVVFGNDPGTKAVLVVFETEAGIYGENQVFAVVQLPPEALADLAERKGSAMRIEGRLEKIDSMMRNIYVSDGRIT